MLTIYIGYDSREDIAYEVCRDSILRHASGPVNIQPLKLDKLSPQYLLNRPTVKQNGIIFDEISKAPQSTEFAASRFLSVILQQEGWAIFVDCDVVFMDDIYEIIPHLDGRYPLYCVQHQYQPAESIKMDGQPQLEYARKNWSSFFAFNAGHRAHRRLTLPMINSLPGRDLHRFCWLADFEIGPLPQRFNWLVNVEKEPENPVVAHFTLGGPWFKDWQSNCYDEIWHEARAWLSKS